MSQRHGESVNINHPNCNSPGIIRDIPTVSELFRLAGKSFKPT